MTVENPDVMTCSTKLLVKGSERGKHLLIADDFHDEILVWLVGWISRFELGYNQRTI